MTIAMGGCGTGQEVLDVSRRAIIGKRAGGARSVERESRAHDKRAAGLDRGRRTCGVNVEEQSVGHLERTDVTERAGWTA
jgi:hypothetical protein